MTGFLFYIPYSKARELAAYQAMLIKQKEQMLQESRRKYQDIIPVLEQIRLLKQIRGRISHNLLQQLKFINGAVYGLDEPVYFRVSYRTGPRAVAKRKSKRKFTS